MRDKKVNRKNTALRERNIETMRKEGNCEIEAEKPLDSNGCKTQSEEHSFLNTQTQYLWRRLKIKVLISS